MHADSHVGPFHFGPETRCSQHFIPFAAAKTRRGTGNAADGWAALAAFSCQFSANVVSRRQNAGPDAPSPGIRNTASKQPWTSSKNCIEPPTRSVKPRNAGRSERTTQDGSCFGDSRLPSSIPNRNPWSQSGPSPTIAGDRSIGNAISNGLDVSDPSGIGFQSGCRNPARRAWLLY